MTTRRVIKRSATVEGNEITAVDDPKFITLVKKPANQRSFGILRSEEEDGNVSKPTTKRVQRTRRSEGADNLVRIQLPGDMAEADVKTTLEGYGLSSFTVARSEDGASWVAQNPSAIDCTDTASINLAEGIVAQIKRNEVTAPTEGKGQLTVTSIEFDAEKFADAEAASEWLTRNSVDFDEKALNNPSGNLVLQRAEVAEGEETRLMELEEGVTVTVIRSQIGDIPDGFIAVINEYAYGGWGWGQLDFGAAMADEAVTDALNTGMWKLSDVFREILFYSELPVDVKKELVTRACGQFAVYANDLLDSLPRQLLISVASIQRNEKEHTMKPEVKDPKALDMKRDEATAPVTVAVGSPEFNAAVAESVGAELKRREEQAQADAAAEVTRKEKETEATTEAEAQATVRRNEITEAVKAATEPLAEEIKALKGTTVLRSEGNEAVPSKQPVKRGTGDLFKGVFGPITRSAERAPEAEADAEGSGGEQ